MTGAETPVSLDVTLEANILAQQLASQLDKGVSAEDESRKVPGTIAYKKFNAAVQAADIVSAQVANQRDSAALIASYAAQTICSGDASAYAQCTLRAL
jgi:hypothetical protein